MRYVICFGYVYKVTEFNYRKMLEELHREEGVTMGEYGTYLGRTLDVTDMTSKEAEECLEDLNLEKKRK